MQYAIPFKPLPLNLAPMPTEGEGNEAVILSQGEKAAEENYVLPNSPRGRTKSKRISTRNDTAGL